MSAEDEQIVAELTEPVRASLEPRRCELVEELLVHDLTSPTRRGGIEIMSDITIQPSRS